MGKGNKNSLKKRKTHLKKDNLAEDRIIKSLEKKLKFNKKKKHIPKSFTEDGLDYLLDICDEDTRRLAAESEHRLLADLGDDLDSDSDLDEKPLEKSSKKSVKIPKDISHKRKKSVTESEDEDEEIDEDDICTKNVKSKKKKRSKIDDSDSDNNEESSDDYLDQKKSQVKKKTKKTKKVKNSKEKKTPMQAKKTPSKVISDSDFSETEDNFNDEDFDEEFDGDFDDENNIESANEEEKNNSEENCNSGKKDGIWEDIYGRKRNKDGEVVTENKQKYIAPALRMKQIDPEKSEKLKLLKRQIKGLLNRLAESNMHAIISQLDDLYMSNSRNDMNEVISTLMLDSIIAPVLTAERLVTEHMMCIAILHANVGTEVGAHFIMVLVRKFNEMIQQAQDVENKELDNLVFMICHLYNFKVFGSQLVYQILEKLSEKFTEKEIEIILLILKTAGLRLRKDDPLALKGLILNLQQKATKVASTNTRIQFMLDVLLAIKNNNMSKIPQYDQSHVEHLKKVLRTVIRKGNTVSQLNLSLEDLLNADESGKWWIVGSAWSGKAPTNNKSKKTEDKPVYSQKILDLAKAQRMNTDVRKNIFCILMTAEDYLDAFEKLHHLGLKDRQEREIIYVILDCSLQEKNFNPYYAVLLQKFCDYDRKYQMTIQYTFWDKFKMLHNYTSGQIINMARLLSQLFIQKALPISILKVIQLGELDKTTMKLFKKIMLDILLHENTETCLEVFERIASSAKLHQFRESLRLFINYFLLKNLKKDSMSEKQMNVLKGRIELVDKILITSTSKLAF